MAPLWGRHRSAGGGHACGSISAPHSSPTGTSTMSTATQWSVGWYGARGEAHCATQPLANAHPSRRETKDTKPRREGSPAQDVTARWQ